MVTKLPVIVLTGYLGAGKTTLLNHLLGAPATRIGVVINDFGTINVDAALVSGQVDEPASIAGGCLCCLPDAGGLDDALEKLAQPRRRLDAIVVEASGIAEPAALARHVRFSGVERVRPGGVIDVINAADHFDTVDVGGLPPARYAAASLVVVNQLDRVAPEQRAARLDRIAARVRELNPRAHVVSTTKGRIDPLLVFDPSSRPTLDDQLPLAPPDHDHHPHRHADAVTVPAPHPVDPGRLLDLLERPPGGVYRLKGWVTVAGRAPRRLLINLVGSQLHIADGGAAPAPDALVAIGVHLDRSTVHDALVRALTPASTRPTAADLRRLLRYRRLSE